MTTKEEVSSDHVVPPGWLLEERISLLGWSQAELARRCGRSGKHISEIIQGIAPIEPETALQLEKVLDLSAKTWLNLESSYRLRLARIQEELALEDAREWYGAFPIEELISGGLMVKPKDDLDGIRSLLTFFGVGSFKAWESKIHSNIALARHSKSFQSSDAAVSVWLRLAEVAAEKQECSEYDASAFRSALKKIRLLSRSDPEDFYPRMTRLCADAGVAFVIVPPLKGTKLSGAAWWMSREPKGKTPIIQQSLRGKTNDLFWFTFFHEAAHILLHSRKETFVDEEKRAGEQVEKEADEWAGSFLIPQRAWNTFIKDEDFSKLAIEDFATDLGIAPGIVLGRLQHEGLVPWGSRLNRSLKERFVWEAETEGRA